MTSKADQILDCAERMARIGGYMGFSFREIAKEVGIKSASVHYHFPTKADLGRAVARRYTDRFMNQLGEVEQSGETLSAVKRHYQSLFRYALRVDGLMCLCGLLGAEIKYLPAEVSTEIKQFFTANLDWLSSAFERVDAGLDATKARIAASRYIALLEGALILANSLEQPELFDEILEAD